MILFLTLCYVGTLALLIKLGVIKLTLFWKLSPLLWMLLLLIVLFLPMQWGAPAGELVVLSYVVEVVPNVSGEVTEVPVRAMTPIAKDDVLFQIDRRPYQAEVDRLKAALAAAKQNVPQLKAAFDTASASSKQAQANRDLAKISYDRALAIQKENPAAISDIKVDESRQTLAAAEASVAAAEATQEQRRLAYTAEINGENPQVAELTAQLAAAELNLDWTTVRAPADGTVVNISLRPGQRVANLPMRSWMAFQDRSGVRIGLALPQYVLRHVEPGQPAEVVLKLLPGQTFQATVESISPLNSEGQMQASGVVPQIGNRTSGAERFIVLLKIDDERLDPTTLPGGAVGTAAVYTETAGATHLIRRVMLRMETWMNFIQP